MYLNPENTKQRHNFLLTNIVTHFDDIGTQSTLDKIKNAEKSDGPETFRDKSLIQKMTYYFHFTNPLEWLFLTVFSVVVTSIYYF
jgi:hypothetical protein